MIVPLLITGGVLGGIALFAPRVPSATIAPVVETNERPLTQQIDVSVDPRQWRGTPASPLKSDNPARDAYLALLDMGFLNVRFTGTSDPDLSRFAQGTPVTFAFDVTGVPRHLNLPSWMTLTFMGRVITPPASTQPGQPPPVNLPATPATPPVSLPTTPTTRAQVLQARADALLAQGLSAEPMILEALAAEIAGYPEAPLAQQLLQRAQAIRIARAQEVP